jgi:hypothetical protein
MRDSTTKEKLLAPVAQGNGGPRIFQSIRQQGIDLYSRIQLFEKISSRVGHCVRALDQKRRSTRQPTLNTRANKAL